MPIEGRRYHLAILGPSDTGTVAYSVVQQPVAFDSRGSRPDGLLSLPSRWSSAFDWTGWTASVYADKFVPPPPPPPADTTPPDTTITSAEIGAYVATFTFTGTDDVGVTSFDCRLDVERWQSCTSPFGYGGLPAGEHTIEVRARDSAANVDATPASWTWTVSPPP